MPLTPGQTLNNRYRIVSLLGQGGFGAVYRAWDLSMNAPCALKENLDTTPAARSQFEREARILYTLRHSNLPRVFDYFYIPGQGQYLVMDYIDGEDLQKTLDDYRASLAGAQNPAEGLPESQVLPWIVQVCDALTYLHNQQPPVIHRDIKPANIKVTPRGQAVLVDFGVAKVFNPQMNTTQGARAVTPGFSPLEQYGQGGTDTRSDIYALGATLYALLTGQAPPESTQRAVKDTYIPPEALNLAISAPLAAAINQALRLDPDQRFQSAAQFTAALKGAPPVFPTKASATTKASAAPKGTSKRRVYGLAVAAGVLLLAVLLGGAVLASIWLIGAMNQSTHGASTAPAAIAATLPSLPAITPSPIAMQRMDGDFNVAVTGFSVNGYPQNPALGAELGQGVQQRLESIYRDWNTDLKIEVWGPAQVGSVAGGTAGERAQSAQEIAGRLGADMVVYGQVDAAKPDWQAQPAFYVAPQSFTLGQEIAGSNDLGAPFEIYGASEMEQRLDFNTKMGGRVEVLSRIILGLAYLSSHNNARALAQLQSAESLPAWDEYSGKHVLYLLSGNAAYRNQDLEAAEAYYQKARQENSAYARALVGLGNVYRSKALVVYASTLRAEDINQDDLRTAESYYQEALQAEFQPSNADVPSRVHYGLGEVGLLKKLADQNLPVEPIIAEFEQVIAVYGDGANPRIRDIAGEAHARLGYIYTNFTNQPQMALEEYEEAIKLLYDYPEQAEKYAKSIQNLQSTLEAGKP